MDRPPDLGLGYQPPRPPGRHPRRNQKHRDGHGIVRRCCAFALIVELAVFLLAYPGFWVRHVRVDGLHSLTAEQVFATARVPLRTNIFYMAARVPLTRRVSAIPEVDHVKRLLMLPNTIVLRVVERTPYAVLAAAGQYWLLDTNRVPYRTVPHPLPGLPTIKPIDQAAMAVVIAGRPINADWMMQSYHLLGLVATNNTLRARWITVDQNANLCLNRQDNLAINLGSPDDLPAKLAIADAALQNTGSDIARKVAYIDVTCPTQPAMMLRAELGTGQPARQL
ncbi:MAG: cell division protein FtsQ/DivIB [Capsulimonadaceae bacterium]